MADQSFLSLFITFSLIEFTNRGSGIIDGLFVSNYLDTDSIASVGIAKSIYSFIGIVSGLLAVGMQSRCTHELGEGDIKNLNRVFSAVFYVSIVVSLIFGTAVFLGAEPLAVLMGASGKGAALLKDAADYLRGIAIGIPSTIMALILSAACQLDSAKERVRKATLIYFVSDVVLDYVAVKLHLGVFGIGIATSAAYYLQLVCLLFHFRNRSRMRFLTKFSTNPTEMFSVLSLGTEKALRSFSNFISPVIVNRIILLFGGTIAMSAFSIQKDLVSALSSHRLCDERALRGILRHRMIILTSGIQRCYYSESNAIQGI
ncbi:MAG: MATE family efflux transporter [Candidatus Limivicinus sp.]